MSRIPLVVVNAKSKYEVKEQALQAFIRQHKEVFEEFERLIVDRNEAVVTLRGKVVEHADKLGRSYGPYKIGPGRRTIDVHTLMTELGDKAEPFLKYSVDTAAFDVGVQRGDIPQDLADAVTSAGTPVLRGPKAVSIDW